MQRKMSASSALIEAVKKQRILWDFKCEEYKDNNKKNQAWELVSNECGIAIECAKTKWRGIRDTYIKFKKNKYRSKELGRTKPKAYMYAESLEFMKPLLMTTSINLNPTNKRSPIKRLKPPSLKQEYQVDYPITTVSYNNNINNLKQRNTRSNTNTNESYNKLLFNETTIQQVKDMNATDMLFLSYSKSLNSFTKKRQIIIKRRIAELFADEELEQLREDEETDQTEDARYDCSAYASTIMEMDVAENMNPFPDVEEHHEIHEFKIETN